MVHSKTTDTVHSDIEPSFIQDILADCFMANTPTLCIVSSKNNVPINVKASKNKLFITPGLEILTCPLEPVSNADVLFSDGN